ncbi:MAG: adenylate/guanylate cyclase domain-containing protein [Verrucomicrobiota bacterium]
MKLSHPIFAMVMAAVLSLTCWALSQVEFFKKIEYVTLDQRFMLRNELNPHTPHEEIFLAGIDQSTQDLLGAWPMARSIHGQFAKLLSLGGPKVVTWDIMFVDPTIDFLSSPGVGNFKSYSKEDYVMVDGFRSFPNLITAASSRVTPGEYALPAEALGPTRPLPNVSGDPSGVLGGEHADFPFAEYELPRPEGLPAYVDFTGQTPNLIANSYFGFADNRAASDGVHRYLPLIVRYRDKFYPSLSLQTLMLYYGTAPEDVRVELGRQLTLPRPGQDPLVIPIDENGQFMVNYRHQLEDFQGLSYGRIGQLLASRSLQAEIEPPPSAEEEAFVDRLADSIMLVGFTGKGFDVGTLPINSLQVPKVATHLNALDNILNQDFVYPVNPFVWVPLLFVVIFAMCWMLLAASFRWLVPVGLTYLLLYSAISVGFFLFSEYWLPTALPLGAIFIAFGAVTTHRYFIEDRDKRFIKTAMGAYLPRRVMENVLEDPEALALGGTRREITALFCDIRGFTKYCDARQPEEVVAVLNEYLDVMSEVILRYEGTIDKYIGDCIMAFWNAPDDQPDHAQRAVCCAMEMRYALANYKTTRAGIDNELFECGIGIHTGPALVGNVGATKRFNYTVIGSTVNLAARLEALTKRFTSRIIISQQTLEQIQGDFTITALGEVSVPGFSQRQFLFSVEAQQDLSSALNVGRAVAAQASAQAEDVQIQQPMWQPAPLPEDADIGDDREDPNQYRPQR